MSSKINGPADMLSGYHRFRAGTYREQASLYRDLGAGQSPSVLVIACADSRVDPATIFDAAPGQLFVVRNVANLVPPYETNGGRHGVSAALEYAVTALKVKHVVVLGHGNCGGVAACLRTGCGDGAEATLGEFIGPWVSMLNGARDRVRCSGSFNPQYALELEGIEMSLSNLATFPFVQKAVETGSLELHGAWFAIHHGELHWRNNTTKRFEVVPAFSPSGFTRSESTPSLGASTTPAAAKTSSSSKPPYPSYSEELSRRHVDGHSATQDQEQCESKKTDGSADGLFSKAPGVGPSV